ncbi:MAG TPA: dihydrolipoamide acetyltransferase family protein [Fimbriimonas sp.]|nr:dihydrolipoamide acetyltransferase family protein [Fimbriimonas sp.]
MTEVIMPKMGDGMEEGTLLEWLKNDGDTVKSGEVIGNIQTDKATIELESPASGKLTGILLQAGGTVPVGQPIAAIVKDGEQLPSGWGNGGSASGKATESAGPPQEEPVSPNGRSNDQVKQEVAADDGAKQEVKAEETVTPPTEAAESRVKASPLAKKIAKERNIDLSTIKGTGPGGRIVEKDVAEAKPSKAPAPVVAKPSAEDKTINLPRLRQITAKRTSESKQQVPHFYVTVEVDVERILQLREMFAEENSGKVSINDFVIKACALALQDMPEVNASFEGQTVRQFGAIHVGIAAAVPDGLTVPVIRNANQLTLRQIGEASRSLVQKAKDNKLSMDEVSGSTFSISNMGMLDVDNFLAIINQPNAAILAIASVRKKAVVDDDGAIVARSRMNVTCSFDHRVVDGAIGAKFINIVKDYLQNPTRLLA